MPQLDSQRQRVVEAVDSAAADILSVSHQIHDRPEISTQEVFACQLLAEILESYGFQVERGFAGLPTAFCARKGSPGGARVAFLAEYDALPGIGHGCGHNVIATSALGAGIGLGASLQGLPGEVWVIGTPAEETIGGKCLMVQRGAFHQVDAAMMIHPHIGSFMTTHSLAMSSRQISFFGKATHAATSPWEGVNALDAMILAFNNLNALRQQVRPDARIHGVITKGGDAPNIIPEHTEGRFYVRAATRLYLDGLLEKFTACAQAAALATGCRVEFLKDEEDFDDMLNNERLAQRMRDYMEKELGSPAFEYTPDHFGSIDMGNVSHITAAIHVLIDIACGAALTAHTREFAAAAATPYADQAILRAGKGLALTGFDFLTDAGFRKEVQEEFEKGKKAI